MRQTLGWGAAREEDLAAEALHDQLSRGQLRPDCLEGDLAAQRQVLGLVDLAHAVG